MDHEALTHTVRALWSNVALPSLSDFVAIPAQSPVFDPNWQESGHLAAAIAHLKAWVDSRGIAGLQTEVITLPGRTPLLLMELPATSGVEHGDTVLLYGHLDKQPPVGGWSEGLGPWSPVMRNGRLYGRGAVDDGYAGYAAITALEAVRQHRGSHARCVLVLETGEESGSPDLPVYLDFLKERLGRVSLVVCLDSGVGDYERMWLTTSLRGLAQATVRVTVLEQGQHSGVASGIVPSSFRVLRTLLDRVEDSTTGKITLTEMHVAVPEDRLAELRQTVDTVPGAILASLPFAPGVRAVDDDEVELTLNGTWRPTLSVIGAEGLPEPSAAGNVLRPFTTLCLSFRLPPTADSTAALAALTKALTTDVPYNAQVEVSKTEHADGWNAPALADWLRSALDVVSTDVFEQPWRTIGVGGSIPFMALLGQAYPQAQFLVTGAAGADSNMHVPDESLNLNYVVKLTDALARILHAHAQK